MTENIHAEKINTEDFYKGLDRIFAEKNPEATQRYMEEWLSRAEQAKDSQGIVAVATELGGLYRAMGNTDKALEQHNRVLTILEQIGLSESEHYATGLINLADVYIVTGELDKALTIFLKAEKLLTDRGLKGDYRMAALYNNISMVYRRLDRCEEAEQALEKAFLIIKGIPGCRGETATSYVNLGELQIKQGKFAIAEENFMNAIRIFEEDGGVDVHYAIALAGMGELRFLNKDYQEAESYYARAVVLLERDFGQTPLLEKLKGNLELVRQKGELDA